MCVFVEDKFGLAGSILVVWAAGVVCIVCVVVVVYAPLFRVVVHSLLLFCFSFPLIASVSAQVYIFLPVPLVSERPSSTSNARLVRRNGLLTGSRA